MPKKPEEWMGTPKAFVYGSFGACQTKTLVTCSYYLKTAPWFYREWIDAQPKTDAGGRAHDCAHEPGRLCGQDPVPKLLRLERSRSRSCYGSVEADPRRSGSPRV